MGQLLEIESYSKASIMEMEGTFSFIAWFKTMWVGLKNFILRLLNFSSKVANKKDARRRKMEQIFSQIDFSNLASEIPFFNRTPPTSLEEKIEYLGEFLVEVEKRELAEENMAEKINEEATRLKEIGWEVFKGTFRDLFEAQKRKAFAKVEREFKFFSGLIEAFKKDEDKLPTRAIQENLNPEIVNHLLNEASQNSARRIQEDWNQFVKKEWNVGLPTTITLDQVKVAWTDATAKTAGVTVASAAAGTLVLAMGWHTLAWATANFFPPALAVAGLVTLLSGIANRDKAVQKINIAVGQKFDETFEKIVNHVEGLIREPMESDIDACSFELKKNSKMQIWGTDGDLAIQLAEWKAKIGTALETAKVQYTKAEAEHQMNTEFEKSKAEMEAGDVIASATHYKFAFDGLLNWSSKAFAMELNTWDSKDFQKEFIDSLAKAGLNVECREKFHSARKFRNIAAHDLLQKLRRVPDQTKEEIKRSIADMHFVITVIREKLRER